jgi:hypothetical protein
LGVAVKYYRILTHFIELLPKRRVVTDLKEDEQLEHSALVLADGCARDGRRSCPVFSL